MQAPVPATEPIEAGRPLAPSARPIDGGDLSVVDQATRSSASTLTPLRVPVFVFRWIVVILAVITWILLVPLFDLVAHGVASVRMRLRRSRPVSEAPQPVVSDPPH